MTDLGNRLRRHVDGAAPPIAIDEVLARSAVVRRRRLLPALIGLTAIVVLAGLALWATRSSDEGAGPASPAELDEACAGRKPLPPRMDQPADDRSDSLQLGEYGYFSVGSRGYGLPGAFNGDPLPDRLKGPQVGVVCAELSNHVADLDYRPQSGDAGYLEVGTRIHAVVGYDTTFRVTAERDGELVLFEADFGPIDFSVGLERLEVEGEQLRGTITDRATLDRVIELIEDPPRRGGASNNSVELRFVFRDGTVSKQYLTPAGAIIGGQLIGPELWDIIEEALAGS